MKANLPVTGFARSDIHAKLFVFEEPVGDGSTAASKTHLFFGSANATRRGMVTNWETMIHLESTQPQAFDKLLGDLGLGDDSHGAESFFERLSQDELKTLLADEPSSGDAQVDRDFDHFLRRLRGNDVVPEGNESKDGSSYDVCVKLGVPDTESQFATRRRGSPTVLPGAAQKQREGGVVHNQRRSPGGPYRIRNDNLYRYLCQ